MGNGNSADRRRLRRQQARVSRASNIQWCLAGVMAIILWLVQDRGEFVTILLLTFLGSLLVYPVWHLPVINRQPQGVRLAVARFLAILGICIAVCGFGVWVWPPTSLGELTPLQRAEFSTTLKTQVTRTPIHLMCPPADERECVTASQFITIFEQAGWQVKGRMVERVVPGTPQSGLYFVLHSAINRDPAWPSNKGVWIMMPPGYYAVKEAFRRYIKTGLQSGTNATEGEIGIYFGPGTTKR